MNILHISNGWPVSGGLIQICNYIMHSNHKHIIIGNGQDGYSFIPKLI